jgi:hypothetical protein
MFHKLNHPNMLVIYKKYLYEHNLLYINYFITILSIIFFK